ncbi:MAG: Nif3-like dinuclear metal center hexameric protein [Clostridia bacterium]|nr:Nif3-like dinuclear metal center hexameric protein [Clostridia bacterium]
MSVALKDIIAQMEVLAPQGLAADWDNCGLLFGDPEQPINKILLALEADMAVVAEAEQKGCELLIVHHPLIFKPLKKLFAGNYVSDVLISLIKKSIACYAAHTNLDNAPLGVNFALTKALGLTEIEPLAEMDNDNPCYIGTLSYALEWLELVKLVKSILGIDFIKTVPKNGLFQKIAVCGGAGMSFWQFAQKAGADCLISADSSYHEGIEASHAGMALIDGGHYHTEFFIVSHLAAYLKEKFTELEVHVSTVNTNPWQNF